MSGKIYVLAGLAFLKRCFAALGAHVVVLPKLEIGDNTVIGAEAVVTRSVFLRVIHGRECRLLRWGGRGARKKHDVKDKWRYA